jgi:hypothetical protein
LPHAPAGRGALDFLAVLPQNIRMESTFKLNTKELSLDFITILRKAYPAKDIEITVQETGAETEYLLQSRANRDRLLKSIDDIEHAENIVSFDTLEKAIKSAQG